MRRAPFSRCLGLVAALAVTSMATGDPPTVTETSIAGRSVDRVLLPAVPGVPSPAWVLLTSGSDEALRIDFFAPRLSDAPVTLSSTLPEGSDALAVFDLDGDGDVELLVGGDGWLASLGPIADLARSEGDVLPRRHGRVEAPGLDLAAMERAGLLAGGGPDLPLATAGRLRIERAGRIVDERALPSRARRSATGIVLSSPPVQRLPDGRWIVGPEAHGDLRLRSLVLPAAGDAGNRVEAWSRFRGPETVATARYTLLDGAPALIATTFRADKLGIFERQKLRIFHLGTDRTREGGGPQFETITESRRWQRAEAHLVELTGDDRQDLLLIHAKGLGGKELLVDTWEGRGGGRFGPEKRRSALPFQSLDWHYGMDLTGDGIPDLLAAGEDGITLFAGTPAGEKRPIERDPRWLFRLPTVPKDAVEETEVSVSVGSDGASAETIYSHYHFDVGTEGVLIERNVSWGSEARLQMFFLDPAGAGSEVKTMRIKCNK
ncbi:MAG: hypothetical protein AAF481_07015 [Acidobacteriota bacterium]